METKLVKKGLQSIYGGLQMLSENKTDSLSALAEISIILSNSKITERYQIGDNINELLGSIHFLLKDLSLESVKLITNHIQKLELENDLNSLNNDYKERYEIALEKLNKAQEELLILKGVSKN